MTSRIEAFTHEVNAILSAVLLGYSLVWTDYTLSDLRRVPDRISQIATNKGAFKAATDDYLNSLKRWRPIMAPFILVGSALIDLFYLLSPASASFLGRYGPEMLVGALVLQGAPIGAIIGLSCWILIFQQRHVYRFPSNGARLYWRIAQPNFRVKLDPFHADGSWGLGKLLHMSMVGSIAMAFGLAIIYAELLQSSLAQEYPMIFRLGFLLPAAFAILSMFVMVRNVRTSVAAETKRIIASVGLGKAVMQCIRNPDPKLADRMNDLTAIVNDVKSREKGLWRSRSILTVVGNLSSAIVPLVLDRVKELIPSLHPS